MIPIRFGFRFAGLITLASGISVATRVFHIWYVPLFPLGTYRMTSEDEGVPTSFSLLSLAAAFFNAWGFLVAIGLTALALDAGSRDNFYGPLVGAAILFALVFASWLFLGRTPETRPQASGYAIVGVVALIAYGALGYSVVEHNDHRNSGSFMGQVPEADSKMSAAQMGMGQVKAVPAVDKEELNEGAMVEFEVPGGYAHGIVESKTPAGVDWVRVKAGRKMESLSVHRDALTVFEP